MSLGGSRNAVHRVLELMLFSSSRRYSSVLDCVNKTYSAEGVRGFFRGVWVPLYVSPPSCHPILAHPPSQAHHHARAHVLFHHILQGQGGARAAGDTAWKTPGEHGSARIPGRVRSTSCLPEPSLTGMMIAPRRV